MPIVDDGADLVCTVSLLLVADDADTDSDIFLTNCLLFSSTPNSIVSSLLFHYVLLFMLFILSIPFPHVLLSGIITPFVFISFWVLPLQRLIALSCAHLLQVDCDKTYILMS